MEIELELKKGHLIRAFALAKEFVNIEGLRLANKSKAERGYALVENRENIDINHFLPNFNWYSLPIAEGLNQLLEHWQHYEECWLEKQPQAKQHVGHLLVLIQQFLIHYSHSVPHYSNTVIKRTNGIINYCGYSTGRTLLNSANWLHCKLAFTQWVTALTIS